MYSIIISEPEKDEIEIIGLLDPLSELVPTKIFHFESSTRHSSIGADSKIPIYHLAIYGCLTGSRTGRLYENVLQVFGIVAHLQFLRNISRSWLSTPAADPLHKFPPLKYLQILHHSQKLLLSKKTLSGHFCLRSFMGIVDT